MRARAASLVLLLGVAGACRGPHPPAAPAACTHVQAVRQLRGAEACEDVWTCARPPGGRFDRVGLHRLAACEGASGPVVVYLPGMHMNGELPLVDPREDFRVYLAAAGVRTWGFDYRTHAVPADASPADLQTFRRWTSEVFTDDAAWALAFARAIDPGPVYLAGFSAGATFAYRVAGHAKSSVAGLVILDGTAGSGRARDSAGPAIDVGGARLPYPERARLLAAVIADPRGRSPLDGFPTAGDALAEVLYSAPSFGGRGGLSNARDGVADVEVVAKLLRSYDRWWPSAAMDGDVPSPPGPVPVLAFASRNMGPEWVERVRASARAWGGDGAVVRELPGYGHLDVLVGRRAPQEVFEPARAWILGVHG